LLLLLNLLLPSHLMGTTVDDWLIGKASVQIPEVGWLMESDINSNLFINKGDRTFTRVYSIKFWRIVNRILQMGFDKSCSNLLLVLTVRMQVDWALTFADCFQWISPNVLTGSNYKTFFFSNFLIWQNVFDALTDVIDFSSDARTFRTAAGKWAEKFRRAINSGVASAWRICDAINLIIWNRF
jgi:hypothetical protein